jgi:hypothetical protein
VDCTISEEEAAEMDQYPWHMCDDGTYCTLPAGYTSAKSYKCQEGIVTENCTLCNETSGSYQCTYNYANGTIKMMPSPQPINNITSDIYMDILAGFPRPTKCCLYDEMSDTKYSFTKRTFNTAVNKPIVFPKSGGNVDCGIGADTQALGEVSTFCSLQPPPMQDFDITCDIS